MSSLLLLLSTTGGSDSQPAQPTVPAAVSNLAMTTTPTTTGGTLTWTLPDNGGASITSQTIQRSPAGANNWTTLSSSIAGNATSFTDTTAASSTQYDYRHRSTNSVGNSNFSNVVTITTASSATVPAAVNNLALPTPTTTGGTLTWTLPNNGGSPLVSQRIERSPAGANTWSILDNAIAANATSFTDTTAAANTAYDYRHRSTNGVGNSNFSNVVTITTTSGLLTLDAPVTTGTIAGKTTYAYGFDRMVETFAGNTVRLQRLSDNAQSDFGFDTSGRFDLAAVNTWRSGADVNVVRFYDQMGTAVQLNAEQGAVAFIRSNSPYRLATTINNTTGQLTRDNTQGCIACFLDGTSCLATGTTALTPSTQNLEFHVLYSNQNRKIGSVGTDPVGGGTSTNEYILGYGLNVNNQLEYRFGGTTPSFIRMRLNSSDVTITTGDTRRKANSQNVESIFFPTATAGTDNFGVQRGGILRTAALNATHKTAISTNTLNNGRIVFGNRNGTTTGTLDTGSARLVGFFSGLIVTGALTDAERFGVTQRLKQIGQQHRVLSKTAVENLFDEIFVFGNVNTGTNQLAGAKGNAVLRMGNASGTPNQTYNSPMIRTGVNGVLLADKLNLDNGFIEISATPFFDNMDEATFVCFTLLDANALNGGLNKICSIASGTPFGNTGRPTGDALNVGYDHSEPSLETKIADAIDTQGRTGDRKYLNGNAVGDNGSAASASLVKYNYKTANANLIYGTTDTNWGVVIDQPTLENQPTSNLRIGGSSTPSPTNPAGYDQAIFPATRDNVTYPLKRGVPLLQISTFRNNNSYNKANYAGTNQFALTADTGNYMSNGGMAPIGHDDGSVAEKTATGTVHHASAGSRLMSANVNEGYTGHYALIAIAKRRLTAAEIEQVQVNFHKMFG